MTRDPERDQAFLVSVSRDGLAHCLSYLTMYDFVGYCREKLARCEPAFFRYLCGAVFEAHEFWSSRDTRTVTCLRCLSKGFSLHR